ncbi:MAG TPA: 4-hydroxythreonine-4-phosphate dehydrogenase PdxA [Phycisphaerales bacterium]|nr:4-hydroxythreonine-4-phosphate dehydrogenase PdxA [Phycisphaerales bacterium]
MNSHIGITMGDPGGIGPEVVVRALADERVRGLARFTVFGVEGVLAEAARVYGVGWPAEGVVVEARAEDGSWHPERGTARGHDARNGEASFRFVERAIECAKLPVGDARRVDAVVTGPISKEAWALAGHRWPGHTELFAARFGTERYAMMFYAPPAADAPSLNVILATTHVPLRDVPGAVTRGRVLEVIELADEALRRLGVDRPRVGVCGLNPHAGESGLLGTEDRDVIAPAVEEARARGIEVTGPWPGDTVFLKALHGPGQRPSFDIVVAMYHDQGLAPVKLMARDRTVNVTVGLPVVRTSPDHGTAFDIAGKGVADAGSMKAAIELAVRMSR